MDEIIYRQQDAAKAMDAKAFVLAVAGVILRLAIAQIIVNLLISLSGTGLLNLLFYVYAVWLVFSFMRRTVASYVYTLRNGVIYLERRLGDSTNTLVEIPLSRVVSLRPVFRAEKLSISYPQVTEIDPACVPGARMRAAFAASLVSARLARALAGKQAQEQAGWVIVFHEDSQRRACVFRPDETMLQELRAQLGEAFGFDDRMTRSKLITLRARALERAFPQLYPFVEALVSAQEIDAAREEIDRQKAERAQKSGAKKGAQTRKAQGGKKDEPNAQDVTRDADDRQQTDEMQKHRRRRQE